MKQAKKPKEPICLLEIKVLIWCRGWGIENMSQKLLALNQEIFHGTLDIGPIGCIIQSKANHRTETELLI